MEKLSKKTKHDHTLTSILKFAIFSIIMLAPVFSVASRCLYVICNKNAKDSYSEITTSFTSVVSQGETTIEGMTYQLVYTGGEYVNNQTYYVLNSNTNIVDLFFPNETWKVDRFTTYFEHGNTRLIVYDLNGSQHNKFDWELVSNSFYFVNKNTLTLPNTTMYYKLIYTTYSYGKLDNAFEYSLSQLEESNYYNWATNLGIYTPIYNMVHGLGGHDIIALLLAYWSIYTAIYIVFDIVIACFVKITHLLQSE